MDQQEKKITANEAIILMVNAANQNKLSGLYNTAERYLQTLSANGDAHYRIKRLLKERPMQMQYLSELSSDIKNLIILDGAAYDGNVYINQSMSQIISDIKIEWENKEAFHAYNLPIRNKILFHGPTGMGKSTIARHIAEEVQLPFVEIKSDIVIDSHLGGTSGHIYKIVSNIKQPCVLFWDEVDSIAQKRSSNGDNAAVFENDRMTNSLLTNLDKLSNDIIFIAATNRMEILDSAFVRRFDIIHSVDSPSEEDKGNFGRAMAEYYKLPALTEIPDKWAHHNNFSEIKGEIISLARKHVLKIISDKTK